MGQLHPSLSLYQQNTSVIAQPSWAKWRHTSDNSHTDFDKTRFWLWKKRQTRRKVHGASWLTPWRTVFVQSEWLLNSEGKTTLWKLAPNLRVHLRKIQLVKCAQHDLHCIAFYLREGNSPELLGNRISAPPQAVDIFSAWFITTSETQQGKNITLTHQQRTQTEMLTLRIKFSKSDSLIFVS